MVAAVGDADALVDAVRSHDPDLAVIDVRMPPTLTDDGARAAVLLRAERPGLPMMLLSQHVETRHSLPLVASDGFGYLLKDRVLRVDDFLDAVRRVVDGGSALDPGVMGALLAPPRGGDELAALSARRRGRAGRAQRAGAGVLALVAEGRTDAAIASGLVLAERTVETHMRAIFGEASHRRRRR